MRGKRVLFSTGTDEHGLKVASMTATLCDQSPSLTCARGTLHGDSGVCVCVVCAWGHRSKKQRQRLAWSLATFAMPSHNDFVTRLRRLPLSQQTLCAPPSPVITRYTKGSSLA